MIDAKCCPLCKGSGSYAREEKGNSACSSLDVYRRMRPDALAANADGRERFWALMLDVKNRIIGEPYLVSMGSLSASIVHPREAFRAAIEAHAHAVIFVHNHPSGVSDPSDADNHLTARLAQAGGILGISVLDHVVIGDDNYFSYTDAGSRFLMVRA